MKYFVAIVSDHIMRTINTESRQLDNVRAIKMMSEKNVSLPGPVHHCILSWWWSESVRQWSWSPHPLPAPTWSTMDDRVIEQLLLRYQTFFNYQLLNQSFSQEHANSGNLSRLIQQINQFYQFDSKYREKIRSRRSINSYSRIILLPVHQSQSRKVYSDEYWVVEYTWFVVQSEPEVKDGRRR